jgi:hypothetical protein
MTGEPQTTRELYDDIIARRGGAERFSPEQLRLVHALVIALAKPAETDPLLVERLLDLLPKPVSAPESSRDDRDAAIAPLLKLYRHLHESVHTLSAENAQLRAALRGSTVIDPPTRDIVPPSERAECDPGARPGPDDPPKPRVIDARPNPPAASAPTKPPRPAWEDWLAAGGQGGARYDRWSNRNGA